MGGEVQEVIHTPLPNDIDHYIIVIKRLNTQIKSIQEAEESQESLHYNK